MEKKYVVVPLGKKSAKTVLESEFLAMQEAGRLKHMQARVYREVVPQPEPAKKEEDLSDLGIEDRQTYGTKDMVSRRDQPTSNRQQRRAAAKKQGS